MLFWARTDLNRQPRDYESPALTVELHALTKLRQTGFEPVTDSFKFVCISTLLGLYLHHKISSLDGGRLVSTLQRIPRLFKNEMRKFDFSSVLSYDFSQLDFTDFDHLQLQDFSCNAPLRRLLLYPAELLARSN